ncbi:hypothetical protein ACS0TY_016421 [Phlomoides rotata]
MFDEVSLLPPPLLRRRSRFALFSLGQMIDLYWTVLPVLLVHYFAAHPLAESNYWRSRLVFLLGICFPFYVVHSKYSQLNIWDVVATLVCLTGVTLAYFADSQLHNFVCRNQRLKILGQELVPNLDEGLWNYSCHPNYFGEQLWWWGLAIFAWNLDCRWSFIGTFINHLCLAYVTVLVEEYMLKQEYRAEAYKKYLIQSQYGYLGSRNRRKRDRICSQS